MKISRAVTPRFESPAPVFSAIASPSEVDTEFFEDAEEDKPGLNQRLLFLRHPPVPCFLN